MLFNQRQEKNIKAITFELTHHKPKRRAIHICVLKGSICFYDIVLYLYGTDDARATLWFFTNGILIILNLNSKLKGPIFQTSLQIVKTRIHMH